MITKKNQSVFGLVPQGFKFKLESDHRFWFKDKDQQAFTYEADNETKVFDEFPFHEKVMVYTN